MVSLNPAKLDAILKEARACFLYEDAPDYLAILEQGIQQQFDGNTEYAALMRAAHSLKGGAGLAQLHSLSKLAHKLEDLFEALHEQRVPEPLIACELVSLSVETIRDSIAAAISGKDTELSLGKDSAPLPIVTALDSFLEDLPKQVPHQDSNLSANLGVSSVPLAILKASLELDLEDCLQRVEQLLPAQNLASLHEALTNLVEECTLLGQTLNLTWLTDVVDKLAQELSGGNPPLDQLAKSAIASIRQLREQVLNPTSPLPGKREEEKRTTETQRKQRKREGEGEREGEREVTSTATEPTALSLNLRIPVSRLDRMSNTVGELLISHERLSLYQVQLFQANLMLRKQTQQMNPVREQVQEFYDRLATPLLRSSGVGAGKEQKVCSSQLSLNPPVLSQSEAEFDPLQFDRYTEFHSTLQDFQELMVRVEEGRNDIEVIARELHEALEQLRLQLDSLRGDLTESRLVPFGFLADRFVTPLQSLNQRYHKSVALDVVGKETPIDRVILEQLQTPLTHLLRNAFDHGIETPEERLLLDKPVDAKITLSADVKGNKVTIAISDNGRGIDCKKIYQKAVDMGLCSLDAAALTREQILNFLFTPGFSTAATVTDLSGRGVGLDVVLEQVGRLRGEVKVISNLGQGTTFKIIVPLTLSILPLLLCRCQQRLLAIPSINVLEIIALSEYTLATGEAEPHCLRSQAEPGNENPRYSDAGRVQYKMITWRSNQIPVFPLSQLLPYAQADIFSTKAALNPYLGIVLDVEGEPIVVAVDSLVGERELVLKPFDASIPVPAYVAGCTVLGTGEVVPVLSPSNFGELIALAKQALPAVIPSSPPNISRLESSDAASTILIVDDSIAVRRMLNRVLTESGYQVVECRDGKEALELLNQSQSGFDLAISDIEMPRLDGFALLREISMHPRWHSLKIIMLTSRENDRHRQKAMSLGATAYLTKPFRPGDLLAAIASACP